MFSYTPEARVALRQDLLGRLIRGEALAHICAGADMPCADTVAGWARSDPGFAAELAQARRLGADRRRHGFDEAKAARLLARLAAGETITAILRDPDMPSRRLYDHWRATQGPFQAEVHRLNQARAAAHVVDLRARRRDFDQAQADEIIVRLSRGERLEGLARAHPHLPCREVVRAWRRRDPDFGAAVAVALKAGGRMARGANGCTEALTAEICDAIRMGASLASLGDRADMPSRPTLYRWMAIHPAFAREVSLACDDREDWFSDQVQMAAEGGGSVAARRARIIALKRQWARLRNRPGRRTRHVHTLAL